MGASKFEPYARSAVMPCGVAGSSEASCGPLTLVVRCGHFSQALIMVPVRKCGPELSLGIDAEACPVKTGHLYVLPPSLRHAAVEVARVEQSLIAGTDAVHASVPTSRLPGEAVSAGPLLRRAPRAVSAGGRWCLSGNPGAAVGGEVVGAAWLSGG